MTWYAASAIDDALDATRAFLFPFDGWRWVKLAIVAFFLGGAGGGLNVPSSTGNVDVPSDGRQGPSPGAGSGAPAAGDGPVPGSDFGGVGTGPTDPGVVPGVEGSAELAVILGTVAVVLLIVLAFAIVGAVMEFVLLDALRTNEVHLRRYLRTRFGKGVRLFAFRFGIGLLLVLAIGVLVVAGVLLADGGTGLGPDAILGVLAVGVPLIVVLAAIVAVVLGLTTEFVAPVMVSEDVGVLAGWRRFWPTLTTQWKQYGLYLVLRLILAIAVGIAAALVTVIAVVALAIALAILGVIAAFALGGFEALVSSTFGLAILAVLGVVFLVCALAVVLVIRIPVVTYFRCYALAVLADTEPAFDLLSALRDEQSGVDSTPASG